MATPDHTSTFFYSNRSHLLARLLLYVASRVTPMDFSFFITLRSCMSRDGLVATVHVVFWGENMICFFVFYPVIVSCVSCLTAVAHHHARALYILSQGTTTFRNIHIFPRLPLRHNNVDANVAGSEAAGIRNARGMPRSSLRIVCTHALKP